MPQPFPSFLDVFRSLAGRMRDETGALRWLQCPHPVSRSRRQKEHCKNPHTAGQGVCGQCSSVSRVVSEGQEPATSPFDSEGLAQGAWVRPCNRIRRRSPPPAFLESFRVGGEEPMHPAPLLRYDGIPAKRTPRSSRRRSLLRRPLLRRRSWSPSRAALRRSRAAWCTRRTATPGRRCR
jgi:hypothetical protein